MKPTITFDKTTKNFVLKAFDKGVDEKGYIEYLKLDGKNHKMEKEKCGICGKKIHIDHFAGVVHGIGLICDDIVCLVGVADHIGKRWDIRKDIDKKST